MKTLQFLISNNKLSLMNKPDKYSLCSFEFEGREWNSCKAIAVFEKSKTTYPVAINKNGICEIPNNLLDGSFFRIQVIRINNDVKTKTNTILINKEV